jgi:serine/threonine protein kinase
MGLGTIQFASPEQFDDAAASDVRSDIYSLAATLYTALTGENPFGKGTMLQLVQRKLMNQFVAPIQKLPTLRPAVDAAIRMALQSERDKRPESVSEFVAYLTGWKKIAAAAPLPGAITNVAPLGKVTKKSADERRVNTRYEVEVTGDCRPAIGAASQRWGSTIMDISTTGVCLQAPRRFEPGSLLEIVFSVKPDDSAVTHLTRVRWNKGIEGDTWLHGCEFVKPIAEGDLEAVFSDLMENTRANMG